MSTVLVGSVAELALWLRKSDLDDGYRAVLGFVGESSEVTDSEFVRLVADTPPSAGSAQFDALLAAVVEHLLTQRRLSIPAWCLAPERFLNSAWFPIDFPSIRIRALVSSPASFWRRLIFVDRSDLQRV